MRRTSTEAHSTERPTDNASIAAAADRVAALIEAEGGVRARIQLWRHAAAAVRASAQPLTDVVRDQGVEGVHQLGIGYLVGGLLTDLVRTCRLPLLDQLERRAATGTVLQRVPGIGPRLARELREVLGIESLEGLARAAQEGTLSDVCGFGPRRTRMLARLTAASPKPAQLDLWTPR